MADARDLALPLVGGGDHDWNELFYRFGLLTEPSVKEVSGATHHLGTAIMLLGLAWCAMFVLPARIRSNFGDTVSERWPKLAKLLGCDPAVSL